MRVLSVTSECAPLVKTGGLADVAGALPAALAREGVEMRTILPGYPAIMARLGETKVVLEDAGLFGGPVRALSTQLAGLDLYVVDAPHLYDRPGGIYLRPEGGDWWDNPERFAALSWVAARMAAEGADGWRPHVLHCHDWQGGFAPLYARAMGAGAGSVMTIHNMAFHGPAPADRRGTLRLPGWSWHPDGVEFYGHISALKAGLMYADRITTVSPSYARELMTRDFGMGLDGVMRARRDAVSGILNGIDTDVWNPATDPAIETFEAPTGKAAARAALVEEFGLPQGDGPIAVVISRLTAQKGLDLLLQALPRFAGQGGRVVLLGSGDRGLEDGWRAAAHHLPGVAAHIGYDEAMSHRLIAGGDAVLVPSRFEPCGLTQLYGLRYGAVPVVARTGGLADTVIDANDAALKAGVATGLQFAPVTAEALSAALDRLLELHRDSEIWAQICRNAMAHPVDWGTSAAAYAALYKGIASDT
ncbi:glycogen synthase GlgA [Rhodobacteraceae bacterium CCMM004]|nr:glycogen synthase GlgA [Rhodobacteraceae bacterium CCMM004]